MRRHIQAIMSINNDSFAHRSGYQSSSQGRMIVWHCINQWLRCPLFNDRLLFLSNHRNSHTQKRRRRNSLWNIWTENNIHKPTFTSSVNALPLLFLFFHKMYNVSRPITTAISTPIGMLITLCRTFKKRKLKKKIRKLSKSSMSCRGQALIVQLNFCILPNYLLNEVEHFTKNTWTIWIHGFVLSKSSGFWKILSIIWSLRWCVGKNTFFFNLFKLKMSTDKQKLIKALKKKMISSCLLR